MRKIFWLVTTDHLTDRIWFKDDEDFKAAMNIVAVLSTMKGVYIISFILMSNHVHFVLGCDRDLAETFITRFKKMYSQYYSKKYGSCELLRDNAVDFQQIVIGDESFERGVAYVLMNSVAARICLHASKYPWGAGACFFNPTPVTGTRIGDMSARARMKILRSRVSVPEDYTINERGYVNPSCYVPVRFVESVFRTAGRMTYFLNNSSKAKRAKEAPAFKDQIIGAAIQDLLVSLFRKHSLDSMDDEQKSELFRQIKFRFSADPAQIARVCGEAYEKVCELLESFTES
jgi:REP element-mobilizing transposase RayT